MMISQNSTRNNLTATGYKNKRNLANNYQVSFQTKM